MVFVGVLGMDHLGEFKASWVLFGGGGSFVFKEENPTLSRQGKAKRNIYLLSQNKRVQSCVVKEMSRSPGEQMRVQLLLGARVWAG